MKMSRKALIVFFLFLFFMGFLLLVFVTPVLMRNTPLGLGDPAVQLVSYSLSLIGFFLFYYVVSYGSPRQVKILWTIVGGIALAWLFATVSSIALRVAFGTPVAELYVQLFFLGLAIGVPIANWLARRYSSYEPSNLDST
jgi:hypothetical protein